MRPEHRLVRDLRDAAELQGRRPPRRLTPSHDIAPGFYELRSRQEVAAEIEQAERIGFSLGLAVSCLLALVLAILL